VFIFVNFSFTLFTPPSRRLSAARLGLSPDPMLGQGSPSEPPSGLAPSVPGAGTPRSQSEERRQAEGVLDPLAETVVVTRGGSGRPACPPRAGAHAGRAGDRSLDRHDDAWAGRSLGASGVRGGNGAEAGGGATLSSACRDRGPRGLPTGTIGLGLERVSIRGYPCFALFTVCLELAISPFQQAEAGLGWFGPNEGPQDEAGFGSRCCGAPRRFVSLRTRCSPAGGPGDASFHGASLPDRPPCWSGHHAGGGC
jgi:hypothetical protein